MKRTPFRNARRAPPLSIRKFGIGILVVGLALTASAKDATSDATPATKEKAPSAKAGTSTTPRLSSRTRHWLQVGAASWYGSHFQGRRTAAGERFDMNTMTCAHRSLPMGTWLRVTNLKNRKSAFVRVNDRGPVLEGRIVDLSFAAARTLGLAGVGRVRIEAIRDGDPLLAQALVAQLQMPVMFDPLAPLNAPLF